MENTQRSRRILQRWHQRPDDVLDYRPDHKPPEEDQAETHILRFRQHIPYNALPAKVGVNRLLPVYYQHFDGPQPWMIEAYLPADYKGTPYMESCIARLIQSGARMIEVVFITDCPPNRRWDLALNKEELRR